MGAAESNAGDDFHFWWAAERALALIDPRSTSTLLHLERLAAVDDDDDRYDVVDASEYIGGESLAEASTLLVSQLKYSTRQPEKAWSAARLAEKRGRRGATGGASQRSVVRDLATAFRQLVDGHGEEAVVRKVRIRLVTNQPLDPVVGVALEVASGRVRAGGAGTRGTLLNALDTDHAAVIRTLSDAVGDQLSSSEFCSFLLVLDLSLTGTLARGALARRVQARTARSNPGRGPDSARRLFDLVRTEALPESQGHGIRAVDVFTALGVSESNDLYPAPARLTEVPDPLPTPGARAIADALSSVVGTPVVAHGGDGAGKTTALQLTIDHLPAGSLLVTYDCYGGGDYLSSGEERHPTTRFVMQVVNELAQSCGTPLVLEPPTQEGDLWRLLSRTLARAVESLAPDALLVLGVDAADNAAEAAAVRQQDSFLAGLRGLALPARVRLVLTCRSNRIGLLGMPDVRAVPVAPFDRRASGLHLRRYVPSATDADAEAFHSRSAGNPRRQFYVLSQTTARGWSMPGILEACDKTMRELFRELVDSALARSGAASGTQRWLAVMLALARPVSTDLLAIALDVDHSEVVAFALGLAPGVRLEDGVIAFRDEDFETYARERVGPEDITTAHGHLADLLLGRRHDDPDAAAYVADHLSAAGRHSQVIQLLLAEDQPVGILDGFRRQEVQSRRIDLATLAAAATDDAAAAVLVAAHACTTASRQETLSRLVETRLDLVARHTDVDTLRSYAQREGRGQQLGPVHMRLAAALSRDPMRQEAARNSIDQSNAWIRQWMASEEPRRRPGPDSDDVAALAEAHYRLEGPEAAAAWLRRWRPASFSVEASDALAVRLAPVLGLDTVLDALRACKASPTAAAPFVALAARPGDTLDPVEAHRLAKALLRSSRDRPDPSWQSRMLELAVRHGDRADAARLADYWSVDLPSNVWAFYQHTSEASASLRSHAAAAALAGTALQAEDVVPATLRPREVNSQVTRDPEGQRRVTWTRTVGVLLAMAGLATRAVAGDPVHDSVLAEVNTVLAGWNEAAQHRWFRSEQTFFGWAPLAAEALAEIGAADEFLDLVADSAPALVREHAAQVWLDLAAVLGRYPLHGGRAIELCVRATTLLRENALPSGERLELLARAADLAGDLDPAVGGQLFDDVLRAASDVNDDVARLLAVPATLASRCDPREPMCAELATRLVRRTEGMFAHVSDPRVVPAAAVVAGASRLDAATGLAAVTRWDDEGLRQLAELLPAALRGAVEGGKLSPEHALHLDHLVERDHDRLSHLLDCIDHLPGGMAATASARRATARTAQWLRQDVPAHLQPSLAERLLAHPRAALNEVTREHVEMIAALELPDEDSGASWSRTWTREDRGERAASLLANPGSRTWRTLREDCEVLQEDFVYGNQITEFVVSVLEQTPATERGDAVAELAEVPSKFSSDVLLRTLARFVERWGMWPGVLDGARAALPALITRELPHLAMQDDMDAVVSWLRTIDADAIVRVLVLRALPAARPNLSALGLQNVADLLAHLCPPTEALEALEGFVGHEAAAHPIARSLALPGREPGPVAMLLWSSCGHPQRAVRWRAAHAVRDLLSLRDHAADEFLADLVSCLGRAEAGAYRSDRLVFFRFSADAMLLAALARVAADQPGLFEPHIRRLQSIATDKALPHAQIRELARSIVVRCRPDAPVTSATHFANRPTTCATTREHPAIGNDRQRSNRGRYDFDSMDTLPYWYAPLARVFAVSLDDVATRAEHWIIDRWGHTQDDWLTDARELRDDFAYRRMHNDHGTIPPEESVRLYLAYHAMMVTAGQLADEGQAVRVTSWMDEEDPWRGWLDEHLPVSFDSWTADLRGPIPLEPALFGHLPPVEAWLTPGDEEFDQALGLVDRCLSDELVVAGVLRLTTPHASQSSYVASALVHPSTADSLQRALASAVDPHSFRLPDEDDDRFEIDHGRFRLRGWLTRSIDRTGALDDHDPYARGLQHDPPLPGTAFRSAMVTRSGQRGTPLLGATSEVLAHSEQWADQTEAESAAVSSTGSRTRVSGEALLKFLTRDNWSLIVEVQIGRQRRRRDDEGNRPARSRIYVIDGEGRVTTS